MFLFPPWNLTFVKHLLIDCTIVSDNRTQGKKNQRKIVKNHYNIHKYIPCCKGRHTLRTNRFGFNVFAAFVVWFQIFFVCDSLMDGVDFHSHCGVNTLLTVKPIPFRDFTTSQFFVGITSTRSEPSALHGSKATTCWAKWTHSLRYNA